MVATEPSETLEPGRLQDSAEIWRHPSVVALFLDPVIACRDPVFPQACQPDGEYPEVLDFQLRLLASVLHERKTLLPSFGSADVRCLESTLRCLANAHHTALWMKRRGPGHPARLAGRRGDPAGDNAPPRRRRAVLPLGYRSSKDRWRSRNVMLMGRLRPGRRAPVGQPVHGRRLASGGDTPYIRVRQTARR